MSLLKDLVATAGDALRLSSDLMRYKLEDKAKAVRQGMRRMATCAIFGLIALGLAAAGIGFILYGAFYLIAWVTSPGASGLIVGFAVLIIAGLLALLGCGLLGRS
jgi:hypothetical protein